MNLTSFLNWVLKTVCELEKKSLLNGLSDAIKECQLRFGGKRELATDIDGRVIFLCTKLEQIFLHGLKKQVKSNFTTTNLVKNTSSLLSQFFDDAKLPIPQQIKQNMDFFSSQSSEFSFWPCIKLFMNRLDVERFELLTNITNDIGRHRAWIRSCLSEHCLEKYTIAMLSNKPLLREFYEENSFLLDESYSSNLPMLLSGLQSVLFAINIDNANLNVPTKLASPPTTNNFRTNTDETFEKNKKNSMPNINSVNIMKKVKKNTVILLDGNESSESNDEGFKLELNQEKNENKIENNLNQEFKILHNPIKYVKEKSVEAKKEENNVVVVEEDEEEEKLSDDSSDKISVSNLNSNLNLIPISESFNNNNSHKSTLLFDDISVNSNQSGSFGSSYDNLRIGSLDSNSKRLPLSQSLASSTFTSNQTENLSLSELRQVVLTMIQRKDFYEDMNKSLKQKLTEETNRNSQLTEKINVIGKQTDQIKNNFELRINQLENENRLLKEQLKKYVSAVQLMNKPEISIPEKSEILIRDYSHEAEEYEKKLIQVAEMHGELMEFNERLQKMLNFRNIQVKNLVAELTELRGPLPEDLSNGVDDPLNTDNESLINLSLTLINVWVPSAFLRSDKSGSHHVYQIYLRVKDEEWNIYRRFSHFYSMHSKLKQEYPAIGSISFPKKKTIGNKDNKFVEDRRKQLQVYLRRLINLISQLDKDLSMKPCRETLIRAMPFFSDRDFIEQANQGSNSNINLPRSNSNLLISSSLTNSSSPLRRNNNFNINQNELLYTGL
ncbi:unnamed protein product [Brachionus calyciflorus]|uniref:Sorting nexin 29 n=1 Tax=Brachionus calyciflorus TaxID=104777 RepID=A0A813YLQ7_9BILA|nr:unnamed protein product [Brachionus calyciflorus]